GVLSFDQLRELFGDAFDQNGVDEAIRLGVIKLHADGIEVPNMKLLNIAAMLMKEGVPVDQLLKIVQRLRGLVEQMADEIIQLVVTHVFDRYGKDALPPPSEAPRLADLIEKLRPMAMQAVTIEVATAMKKASDKHLGDRLAQALESI